jgi:hypothetical protein
MANVNLNAPILAGGILNTNFFNGRILAAEDLTTFQVANAQQHRQLGRAIGEGVAWGMEVSLGDNSNIAQPILHITRGLALNRKGEAVSLPVDVDLALVKAADVVSANAGLFAECTPPQGLIPTNLDCYLITVSPISVFQGSTPATYPSDPGFGSVCASRNTVEGVKFSRLPLGFSSSSASDTSSLAGQAAQLYAKLKPLFVQLVGLTGSAATALQAQIAPMLSKFRNLVAHLCFGTDTLAPFPTNPFPLPNGPSSFEEYGALDALRDQGILTDCDVPLALVYWTAAGVQFVDLWSVRRPLVPVPVSELWPVFSSRRRFVEGLAMFLQFQEQIAELSSTLASAPLNSITALAFFRYLPAAGLLPAGSPILSGVNADSFFSGIPRREPEFMDGSLLSPLLSDAANYPPADLSNAEMLWLYKVWQSEKAIKEGATSQPYIVFTNPHLPYLATPRFDTARWDYSNFPSCQNCEEQGQ